MLLALSLLLTACGKKKKTEEEQPREPVYEESSEEKTLLFGDLTGGDETEPPEEPEEKQEDEPAEQDAAPENMIFDGTKYQMSFVFHADGTGYVSDAEGSSPVTHWQEGNIITVTIPSEDVIFTGVLQDDGSMYIEAVDDTFVPVDEPGFVPTGKSDPEPAPQPAAEWSVEGLYNYHMEGSWTHWDNSTLSLDFDGESTVSYSLESGSGSGEYRYDGEKLEIISGSTVLTGELDFEGDLWIDGHDGWFVSDKENFFRENNLDANWDADGRYYLANGARYFFMDGSEYQTGEAKWEIVENGVYNNGDGTRSASYTLLCGFLPEENPGFGDTAYVGCTFGIFDAYTGFDLSGDAYYNDANGWYSFRYTQNGEEVAVSYRADSQWIPADEFDEWGFDQAEVDNLFVAELRINLPADYDGIRIVAMTCEPSYEEYMGTPDLSMTAYPEDLRYLIEDGLIYQVR